jgi:dTDP-4-amino-4,6-dideoxygalactose transaminase
MKHAGKFLPFSRPTIDDEMINEVIDSMKSGWLTTGPKVEKFEKLFSEYVDHDNVVSFSTGTAALHIAILLLDLKKGDEVITPSMTWPSAVNMIELCRGVPVFVDCELETLNISVADVERKITSKTKAIIPVHFAGQPVDMDPLFELVKNKDIMIIEDAAHAIGSHYKGEHVGKKADFTIYSFHPNKNMTTGEGGMLTVKNRNLVDAANKLKFHGVEKHAWKRFGKHVKKFEYEVVKPGYKYNMMDIQAAIGIHQLKRLDEFINKRKIFADQYSELLKDNEYLKPLGKVPYPNKHAWHLYIVKLDIDKAGFTRDEFMRKLGEEKIGSGLHYTAIHIHKYYREKYGYRPDDLPNSSFCSDRILSIPLFPLMKSEDQKRVVSAIVKIISLNTK